MQAQFLHVIIWEEQSSVPAAAARSSVSDRPRFRSLSKPLSLSRRLRRRRQTQVFRRRDHRSSSLLMDFLASDVRGTSGSLPGSVGPVCFAEKISWNTILADLLWEKNIVPTEKTSRKIRIIRETNLAYISYLIEPHFQLFEQITWIPRTVKIQPVIGFQRIIFSFTLQTESLKNTPTTPHSSAPIVSLAPHCIFPSESPQESGNGQTGCNA